MIEVQGLFTKAAVVNGVAARVFPVWKGSVRAEVNFTPLQKKAAVKLYHRARAWERSTRQPGRHGGVIGRIGMLVLHSLVFDFLNYRTGQLDPSYEGLAKKAGVSRASVGRALRRLKELGILAWVRRCVAEIRDGRFTLAQERNAYAVQGEGLWQGYRPVPEAPRTPLPGSWGEHPSLPGALAQAAQDQRQGLSRGAVLTALRSDPGDALAAALARMGQALMVRESLVQSGVSA